MIVLANTLRTPEVTIANLAASNSQATYLMTYIKYEWPNSLGKTHIV